MGDEKVGFLRGLLRRLPGRGLLKGIGKRLLAAAVQKLGDRFREELKGRLGMNDFAALDRVVDARQVQIVDLINRAPFLPSAVRDELADHVIKDGDALQEKLKAAIKAEGPKAVDRLFDASQAALIARIEAL